MVSLPGFGLLLLVLFPFAGSICYYPDGSVAPQDTPCRSDTDQSTCCGEGYACLSNNMCKATGNELQKDGASEYVRGSCTDKSWRSGDCPNFCVDPQYDDTAGGTGIGKCDGSDTLFYCIDTQDTDCGKQENVLTFHDAPTAIITIGVTPSSTSSTASSTSTPPAKTSSNRTKKPSPTAKAPDPAASDGGSSDNSKIGIGVGVSVGGLGVVAIAAALVLLRRRRRNKRAPGTTGDVTGQLLGPMEHRGHYSGQSAGIYLNGYGNSSKQIHEAPAADRENTGRVELQG